MWAVVIYNTNRSSQGAYIEMFLNYEVAEREAVLWADAGKQFSCGSSRIGVQRCLNT